MAKCKPGAALGSRRVSVTLTAEDYQRIVADINRLKKNGVGRQLTASKYIANVVRSHLEANRLFNVDWFKYKGMDKPKY